MTRIVMTGLAIGLTALLSGCGWVEPGNLERAVVDAGSAAGVQHGTGSHGSPSSLPPGHPPIARGHGVLPPGHPPIPEGLACPGGGAAREPAGERFRARGTDLREIISI
jgi:hypothetical protein